MVTAGCGLVRKQGEPAQTIRPGDMVWIAPGEKHWHGATPTTAMTHIAIVEAQDGCSSDWMEHVTDEEYLANTPDKAEPFSSCRTGRGQEQR